MRKALLPALLLAALCGCSKEDFKMPAKINYFQIGYRVDTSDESERFDGQVEADSFIMFNDRETVEAALNDPNTYGKGEFAASKYMYHERESVLEIVTSPKAAKIEGLEVTSSNPKVMSIVSAEGNYVHVLCHSLGETTLFVKVKGAMNTLEGEFPIQVTDDCKIDFYITPYWLSGISTRIRFRPTKLPLGLSEVPVVIRDSVTVCGYCRYGAYNADSTDVVAHVKRDSVKLAAEDIVRLAKPKRKDLLRNITKAIKQVRKWYVEGQIWHQDNDTGETTIEDHRYYFIVESVVLDFYMYSSNPYIDFYLTSKCDRTTTTYKEDDDGTSHKVVIVEGQDKDTDDAVECDPNSEQGRALTKSEQNYFVVKLNAFMTDREKAELAAEFASDLDRVGYKADEHTLSEQDKDAQMAEIEKHKKEGDW